MRFIAGSHKSGVIEHKHLEDFRVEEHRVDYEREVAVPLEAGSCSFHHSLLLHSSRPNTTSHSRRGLAYHYMTAESRWTDPDREQPEYPLLRGRSYPGCV